MSPTPTPHTASVHTALQGLPPLPAPASCGRTGAPRRPTNADHTIKNRASLLVPVTFRYKVFPRAHGLARPPGQDGPRARASWHRHRKMNKL